MAPEFDHVRAFVKLLAHRLSPFIRPGGQPRCPHHPNHFVGSIFRGVPPFRRDERPGGKHARSRYAIFPHPFLQPERHVPLRPHVSHTRDTALQEVPQLFRSAQRRVRFVHPHAKIRFRQRVRQVRMEINQARQNRLSENIDHLRIFGPVGRSNRKNLHYLISFDDQRALVSRRTSSIKNSSAAQNDRSLWPSRPRLDHDTPRIIADLRFRIEKLPPVLPSLLRPALRARKRNEQHHQRSGLHLELPPRTRFLPHPVIRRLKKIRRHAFRAPPAPHQSCLLAHSVTSGPPPSFPLPRTPWATIQTTSASRLHVAPPASSPFAPLAMAPRTAPVGPRSRTPPAP